MRYGDIEGSAANPNSPWRPSDPAPASEGERCPTCGTQVRENCYWTWLAAPGSPRVYYPKSIIDDNPEIEHRFSLCDDPFHRAPSPSSAGTPAAEAAGTTEARHAELHDLIENGVYDLCRRADPRMDSPGQLAFNVASEVVRLLAASKPEPPSAAGREEAVTFARWTVSRAMLASLIPSLTVIDHDLDNPKERLDPIRDLVRLMRTEIKEHLEWCRTLAHPSPGAADSGRERDRVAPRRPEATPRVGHRGHGRRQGHQRRTAYPASAVNPMVTREDVADGDTEMLFCDDLDEALVGKVHIWTAKGPTLVALYDYDLCVKVIMGRGATHEEAEEYLSFNTLGAFMGPRTPAFATFPGQDPK